MPLPKRFYDSIDTIPKEIKSFEDCNWMLPDNSRMLDNGRPHGLIWMQPAEAEYLCNLVRMRPAGSNIVEIGRCEGGSTILMGAAKGQDSDLVSLDIDPVDDDQLKGIIEHLGLRFVHLLVADSTKYPAHAVQRIGLLLIDGGHSHECIRGDFSNWEPHVIPGGLIAFHDVNPDGKGRGPWDVYNEILESRPDDFVVHSRIKTLAVLEKK